MRRSAPFVALLVGLGICASACGAASTSSNSSQGTSVKSNLPTAIVPVGLGASSFGPLSANGLFVVLSGNTQSRGVYSYDLATRKQVSSFSVSNIATAVTQLPNGTIAVGLGGTGVGAVDLYSSSGQSIVSIPLAAPVRALALDSDGTSVLVLIGQGTSRAVALLNTTTRVASSTIPVDSQTVAIAPSSHGNEIYGLDSTGYVGVYAAATGQKIGSFAVGHSGIGLSTDPNGTDLFVLKGRGSVRNVAIVDLATESDVRAVPAPRGSVMIQSSLSGHHVLALANTTGGANVQELPLS